MVQLPEQAEVCMPTVSPYRPARHGLQLPAPACEYLPATHASGVALTDPAGQAYPAEHTPGQDAPVWPGRKENRPALHGPLHVGTAIAVDEPYRPAGHGEHAPNPAREY